MYVAVVLKSFDALGNYGEPRAFLGGLGMKIEQYTGLTVKKGVFGARI